MGQARLAEMHLGIDHPRQGMQAPGVELRRGRPLHLADGGDAPPADADIGRRDAIGRGGDGAAQDQVESLAQGRVLCFG